MQTVLKNLRLSLIIVALLWSFRSPSLIATEDPITPYILFVHCDGGWDPTMVFDPKIGVSTVAQETGASLKAGAGDIVYVGHSNRPAVQSFFELHGAAAAIVNGVATGSMSHEAAIRREFGFVQDGRFNDFLSHYASIVGPVLKYPHVNLDAPYLPGKYADLNVRVTSQMMSNFSTSIPGATSLSSDAESQIYSLVATTWADLSKSVASGLDGAKVKTFQSGLAREAALAAHLTDISNTVYNASDSTFKKHGKIAVELFRQGMSQAVTIQAGHNRSWDSHQDHFSTQATAYEDLFDGLNAILSYADTAGIKDKILIIVTSELGRAPSLNDQSGKGHWPYTSVLLWGVGVRGAAVVGKTDDNLVGTIMHPLFGTHDGDGAVPIEMAHIFAAIYTKAGLPIKTVLAGYKPLSLILGD